MSNKTQLIWIGDRYEVADDRNSVVPVSWPVQDSGGRWNYEQFPGQRVAYNGAHVAFGFQAKRLAAIDVARVDTDDLPRGVFVAGREMFSCA